MKFTLCKKQYLYLALAFMSLCFAFVSHVSAEQPVTTENTGGVVSETPGEGLENANTNLEDTESRKDMLTESAGRRIQNLAGNMTARMNAAASRFVIITDRLETRIEKLEMQGYPTGDAFEIVLSARRELRKAQDAIGNFDTLIQQVSFVDSPKESFKAARTEFTTAKNSLLETHRLLREAVTELKNEIRTAEEENGSSPAVANENAANTPETQE